MTPRASHEFKRLKASCLSRGLEVTADARRRVTRDEGPLTVQEYATTNGLTMRVDDLWINAPVGEWYCDPEARLEVDGGDLFVTYEGSSYPCEVLSLPGYLGRSDPEGRRIDEAVFSHADRARLSPISGCSFTCEFCDLAGMQYDKKSADRLLDALDVARDDPNFDIDHVLVSGGTPSPKDREYLMDVCRQVIQGTDLPVDVMMTPFENPSFVDDLVEWGIYGFSFNLEIFSDDVASKIVAKKHRLGKDVFAEAIERAVERVGVGRVRSLLVAGLEPMDETLAGVEWLADKGCDPVLSPFRPAPGTPLEKREPPEWEWLLELERRARDIVEDHDVVLGPRCIPCQHNTLTFPDGSDEYWYAKEVVVA